MASFKIISRDLYSPLFVGEKKEKRNSEIDDRKENYSSFEPALEHRTEFRNY